MKVFIIALIFVAVVAAEAKAKRCRSPEECGENECCAITPGHMNWGRCKPLGKENKRCSREEDAFVSLFLNCPCESGLECRAEKVIKDKFDEDVEYRINERCADPNKATTEAEVTTDDGGEVTIEAE